jgi:hypothetical protein
MLDQESEAWQKSSEQDDIGLGLQLYGGRKLCED